MQGAGYSYSELDQLDDQSVFSDGRMQRATALALIAPRSVWAAACLLLAAAALAWVAYAYRHDLLPGAWQCFHVLAILAAAALVWVGLRGWWFRLEEPSGVVLRATEAPALFEALARMRDKIEGPTIHRVLLGTQFDVSVHQHRHPYLPGGQLNCLTIGMPLLLALDRQRFLAVLAHAYGRMQVHKQRVTLLPGQAAQMNLPWMSWLSARAAERARRADYQADRISRKLLGRQVVAEALTEFAIKSDWLERDFWPNHWRAALGSATPVGPFAAMRVLAVAPVPEAFARTSLREALDSHIEKEDTHSLLRDRLDALRANKVLPAWSTRQALRMLGRDGRKWLDYFDTDWCQSHAAEWKHHHAYLGRVQARARVLANASQRGSADDMIELATLLLRLDRHAQVQPCYERALELEPGHAGALRGLVQCLPASDDAMRLEYAEQLYDNSDTHRLWACHAALAQLEGAAADGQLEVPALARWRERFLHAEETEERLRKELHATDQFQAISRNDLTEFEKGEFQAQMARLPAVTRAWLVRKQLPNFDYRRCYVAFVELPEMEDAARRQICRNLKRSLALPGPALVFWAGRTPTLAEIEKNAFEPVFTRAF